MIAFIIRFFEMPNSFSRHRAGLLVCLSLLATNGCSQQPVDRKVAEDVANKFYGDVELEFRKDPVLGAELWNNCPFWGTDVTLRYWEGVATFSSFRRNLQSQWQVKDEYKKEFTPQRDAFYAMGNAGSCETNEAAAIAALKVENVDQRLLDWTKKYSEWLGKDSAFRWRLFNVYANTTVGALEKIPAPVANSLLQYAKGEVTFSTAWDREQISSSGIAAPILELEKTGRELDADAARLSVECGWLRSALAIEHGKELSSISIPGIQ